MKNNMLKIALIHRFELSDTEIRELEEFYGGDIIVYLHEKGYDCDDVQITNR